MLVPPGAHEARVPSPRRRLEQGEGVFLCRAAGGGEQAVMLVQGRDGSFVYLYPLYLNLT